MNLPCIHQQFVHLVGLVPLKMVHHHCPKIAIVTNCMHIVPCSLQPSNTCQMRPRGRGFEPHLRHCVVSLSKNINPSLVLVQPRKTRPYIHVTERLLMGHKESNQTNKTPAKHHRYAAVYSKKYLTVSQIV